MTTEPFHYFLSEKKSILVVAFLGSLIRTDASAFKECAKEVVSRGTSSVVLSFQDVKFFDHAFVPDLALLFKSIRDRQAILRVCSLSPGTRKTLDEGGILRAGEVCANLVDALKSLPVPPV